MKRTWEEMIVFLRPLGPPGPKSGRGKVGSLHQKMKEIATGMMSFLALLLLSGLGLVSMAGLVFSALLIYLIIDRILGIEIRLPNFMAYTP
jgi:hypothetical protein